MAKKPQIQQVPIVAFTIDLPAITWCPWRDYFPSTLVLLSNSDVVTMDVNKLLSWSKILGITYYASYSWVKPPTVFDYDAYRVELRWWSKIFLGDRIISLNVSCEKRNRFERWLARLAWIGVKYTIYPGDRQDTDELWGD